MKFCTHCGKEIADEAVVCPGCGCKTNAQSAVNNAQSYNLPLISRLSAKIKIGGILYICFGSIFILSHLALLMNPHECGSWFCLELLGGLYIIFGIQDIKYGKSIQKSPVGIISHFKPMSPQTISFFACLIYQICITSYYAFWDYIKFPWRSSYIYYLIDWIKYDFEFLNFIISLILVLIGGITCTVYYFAAVRGFVKKNKADILQLESNSAVTM